MIFLDSKYFKFLILLLINERIQSSSAMMDIYKCNVGISYNCIINITINYGFNLQDPLLIERVPNLSKVQLLQLCRDYVVMVKCLTAARPCDFKGNIYEDYSLALAAALDNACKESELNKYDEVAKCRKLAAVETAEKGCQAVLVKEVKNLLNETSEKAKIGRVDVGVTIEKVCKTMINSMKCIQKKLRSFCGAYVAEWYNSFMLEASKPTLKSYQCELYWKADDIIILCFVSLSAAIIVGIAIYVCIQRYRSFMSSQMNFVLSYVPKASQQIRKFAPSIIPRTSMALKRLSTPGKGPDLENNPAAPTSETVPTSATEPTSASAPSTQTTETTSATQPMPPSQDVTEPTPEPANTWWNRWWR